MKALRADKSHPWVKRYAPQILSPEHPCYQAERFKLFRPCEIRVSKGRENEKDDGDDGDDDHDD
eukprot:766966-Hanusia_phi.AAC.3